MPDKAQEITAAEQSYRNLVAAANDWFSNHMDQWEKFKFNTEFGPVYVTISKRDDYPESFDLVDRHTGVCNKQAGLPMHAFTDYPLVELGDVAYEKAPIRRVEPLSYDGDKYVTVRFEGREFEFKAGYLYTVPGRCGEVETFDPKQLTTTSTTSD